MNTHTVIRMEWMESEKGWGTRPDGYSLHLTKSHLERFVKDYWDSMPNMVPDEYSAPNGNPKLVDIDEELYVKLTASGGKLRF